MSGTNTTAPRCPKRFEGIMLSIPRLKHASYEFEFILPLFAVDLRGRFGRGGTSVKTECMCPDVI